MSMTYIITAVIVMTYVLFWIWTGRQIYWYKRTITDERFGSSFTRENSSWIGIESFVFSMLTPLALIYIAIVSNPKPTEMELEERRRQQEIRIRELEKELLNSDEKPRYVNSFNQQYLSEEEAYELKERVDRAAKIAKLENIKSILRAINDRAKDPD